MTANGGVPCPFCNLPGERIWKETWASLAFIDGFPVAEGHTLIIPKRHVMVLHDLPPAELSDVWGLVAQMRQILLDSFKPDGFNIGVNEGPAAGQTVGHAHVHIIPRHDGDVADPRGGIRWVIPHKAKYW
jgi:diadenosine tetraphosphate (Ap4A) HIT family hydrolase